jgi:hypothetical protein
MIVVENPVDLVIANAQEIAQKVLHTDMTNITMSQWQAELHHEQGSDPYYIAYCAVNRRLDPLEKAVFLHVRAKDFDHLKSMFHYVDFVA